MIKFSSFLNEGGAHAKFKVGNEPTFKVKELAYIAKDIRMFIKSNDEYLYEFHYPATGAEAKYDKNTQFVLKVTSKEGIKALQSFLKTRKTVNAYYYETSVKSDNLYIMLNSTKENKTIAKFHIKYSSGRGFFFEDESSKTTPTTEQQELGTIGFIKYFIDNNEYPTKREISEIVDFTFDDKFYKNFEYQLNALRDYMPLSSLYEIELDSDSKKIGAKIFNILKRKHNFKESKDNWNPADIWVYQKSNVNSIMKKLDSANNITEFNIFIKELFVSKMLIGISLKKALKPTTAKVIDNSDAKPFDLSFEKSVMNLESRYFDIVTKGYPSKFMIRARAKAAAITKESDIKIYFEGKVQNSTEFLGAIPKNFISQFLKNADKTTIDDLQELKSSINDMIKSIESHGFMKFTNKDSIKDLDDVVDAKYLFVLLRYANLIYSFDNVYLNKLGMAGYKMNEFSSIHLKIGG